MAHESPLVKKFKEECNPSVSNDFSQIDDNTVRVEYESSFFSEALDDNEVNNIKRAAGWELERNENGVAIVKYTDTDDPADTLATVIEETIEEWSEENLEDHQSVKKFRYWKGEASVDIHEDPDGLAELRENLPNFAEIDENKFLVRPDEAAIDISDSMFTGKIYRVIAESDYAVSRHSDTHIMVRPEENLLQ